MMHSEAHYCQHITKASFWNTTNDKIIKLGSTDANLTLKRLEKKIKQKSEEQGKSSEYKAFWQEFLNFLQI